MWMLPCFVVVVVVRGMLLRIYGVCVPRYLTHPQVRTSSRQDLMRACASGSVWAGWGTSFRNPTCCRRAGTGQLAGGEGSSRIGGRSLTGLGFLFRDVMSWPE